MSSCVAASEAVAPAKPAWRAVYSLGLGVFGLITAEFLPASLLTPMAASLSGHPLGHAQARGHGC